MQHRLLQRLIIPTCAAVAIAAASGVAQATLIDDQVQVDVFRSTNGTNPFSENALVLDPGPANALLPDGEFNLFTWSNLNTLIDIGASSIRIEHASSGSLAFSQDFYQIVISSLDWIDEPSGKIESVEVNFSDLFQLPNQNDPFSPDNVSHDDHTVTIDIAGYRLDNGDFIDIQLFTDHDVVSIPAPATIGLFGIGLILLGVLGIRR